MKYVIGYVYNPGYDTDRGWQDIRCSRYIALEKSEGEMPSQRAAWKKHKESLKDCSRWRIVEGKLKKTKVKMGDIFIADEKSYLYRYS